MEGSAEVEVQSEMVIEEVVVEVKEEVVVEAQEEVTVRETMVVTQMAKTVQL